MQKGSLQEEAKLGKAERESNPSVLAKIGELDSEKDKEIIKHTPSPSISERKKMRRTLEKQALPEDKDKQIEILLQRLAAAENAIDDAHQQIKHENLINASMLPQIQNKTDKINKIANDKKYLIRVRFFMGFWVFGFWVFGFFIFLFF
jgi:hypothetical protein